MVVEIQETFNPRIYHNSTSGVTREVKDWNDPVLTTLPKGDNLTMVVDWRKAVPLEQKLDPSWFMGNDWDKVVPDWYLPGKPSWYRSVMWYGRNPAENAKRVLIGVGDQNYTVTISRRDGAYPNGDLKGWEVGKIIFDDGKTLPWYSYGSEQGKFYWGWQPVGVGAIKMNGWGWLALPYVIVFALPYMLWARAVTAWAGHI